MRSHAHSFFQSSTHLHCYWVFCVLLPILLISIRSSSSWLIINRQTRATYRRISRSMYIRIKYLSCGMLKIVRGNEPASMGFEYIDILLRRCGIWYGPCYLWACDPRMTSDFRCVYAVTMINFLITVRTKARWFIYKSASIQLWNWNCGQCTQLLPNDVCFPFAVKRSAQMRS